MANKKINDLQLRSNFDATCNLPVDDATQTWRVTGAQLAAYVTSLVTSPTIQKFTSGSGTYTKPTGPAPLYIRVRMIGGGGGGAGGGSSGTMGAGGNGGSTTFGTSLLTCTGGAGGIEGAPQAGGTATMNSPAIGTALAGVPGSGAKYVGGVSGAPLGGGGIGASSPFGGGGLVNSGGAGVSGIANTGVGGGGGDNSSSSSTPRGGGGGAAGGFIDAIIRAPGSSYAYAIGAAGSAGTSGSGGASGGAGGSGYIEVTEYYQ